MKLAENIILLPFSGPEAAHIVLIWDENHLVMIDAGFPGQTEAVIQASCVRESEIPGAAGINIQHGKGAGC